MMLLAKLQITQQISTKIQNDIKNIKGDLSKIDKRVDKSVAGAAALAALHPLDFDQMLNGTLLQAMAITAVVMRPH